MFEPENFLLIFRSTITRFGLNFPYLPHHHSSIPERRLLARERLSSRKNFESNTPRRHVPVASDPAKPDFDLAPLTKIGLRMKYYVLCGSFPDLPWCLCFSSNNFVIPQQIISQLHFGNRFSSRGIHVGKRERISQRTINGLKAARLRG